MKLNDSCWVAIYSASLGAVFILSSTLSWRMNLFVKFMSIFHFLEFFSTAQYNPTRTTSGSFLIPHSTEHTWMVCASILEYSLVCDLLPKPLWTSEVGFIAVVFGQFMRTYAMKSAKASFNHQVQKAKADDHILITSGAYQISRHPSYLGFYWWSIGTQILLGNYLCCILYAATLTEFFRARIHREEKFLIQFFGDDYVQYRAKVGTLIPFVK